MIPRNFNQFKADGISVERRVCVGGIVANRFERILSSVFTNVYTFDYPLLFYFSMSKLNLAINNQTNGRISMTLKCK